MLLANGKRMLLAKRLAISVLTAQSASHQTQQANDRPHKEPIHPRKLLDPVPGKLRLNRRAP